MQNRLTKNILYILYLDNFERYRKYHHCPIKGCKSKSLKKLSNHLVSVHKIVDPAERQKVLREAKKLGVAKPRERKSEEPRLTIIESFKLGSKKDKNIVCPMVARKKGSTRSFPQYDIMKTELASFYENLMSFDGGNRSSAEAMQIAVDISKFLAFSNDRTFSWHFVLEEQKLKSYIQYLKDNGLGPDGILTKIERILTCIKYLLREHSNFKERREDAKNVMDRIGLWKMSFRSDKIKHTKDKAARELDTTEDDLETMQKVVNAPGAIRKANRIIEKEDPSDDDVDFIATYLFLCLSYKNFQRAGPAINMTLNEAESAQLVHDESGEERLKLVVSKHKTASTYGPATLYLTRDDSRLFFHYRDYLRPDIPTSSECEAFLVRSNGQSYEKNYARYVQIYAKSLGLEKPPSLTATRKAGATAGCSALPKRAMEDLSRHMSHSSSTSELYYRVRKGGRQSLEAFKNIQKLSGKCKVYNGNKFKNFLVDPPQIHLPDNFDEAIDVFFKEEIGNKTTPSLKKCEEFILAFECERNKKQVQDRVRTINKK